LVHLLRSRFGDGLADVTRIKLDHPLERSGGCIVVGKRLYFAGDTACTPEMKALKNIDVLRALLTVPSVSLQNR
jgi:hypothetical protein